MRQLLPFAAILTLMLVGCETTNKETAPPPVQELTFSYPLAIYVLTSRSRPPRCPMAASPRRARAERPTILTRPSSAALPPIADAVATQLVAKLKELGLPAVRWRSTRR